MVPELLEDDVVDELSEVHPASANGLNAATAAIDFNIPRLLVSMIPALLQRPGTRPSSSVIVSNDDAARTRNDG